MPAFYTVPSVSELRRQATSLRDAHRLGKRKPCRLLRSLSTYANYTTAEILAARVPLKAFQQALAQQYETANWAGLIFLSEVMEADNIQQLKNRATFLVREHKQRMKTAAVRIRKALPSLRRYSLKRVFDTRFTLRDARQVLAREYGFGRWSELVSYVQAAPVARGFLMGEHALPPAPAQLREAIDAGDVRSVVQLVAANPSLIHARISSDTPSGDTFLHRADPLANFTGPMTPRHLKIAQYLIDEGADIDAMGGSDNSCFTTALDASVWIGNKSMVRLLLRNKADPNLRFWSMPTPIETAAGHNDPACFRLLLKAGAHCTILHTTERGLLHESRALLKVDPSRAQTPGALQRAAAAGLQLTRLLLTHGADPNALDDRGLSPLMAALDAGHMQVVDVLIASGATLDLFAAIGIRDRRTVRDLLQRKPQLARKPQGPHYSLVWAAEAGDLATCRALIENGADPTVQPSPLQKALEVEQDHLIQPLIAAGAPVNPTCTTGFSQLSAAVRFGSRKGLQLLLAAGADPNDYTGDGYGLGLLNWTAFTGDLLRAKLLLDAGANKASREAACRVAAENEHPVMIEYLGAHDTDLEAPHPEGNTRSLSGRHPPTQALVEELVSIRRRCAPAERVALLRPRVDFINRVLQDDAPGLRRLLKAHPELVDRAIVRDVIFPYAAGILQRRPDLKIMRRAVEVMVEFGIRRTLEVAAACGREDLIEEMLPNASGDERVLALIAATKVNHVKLVELLLAEGTDVNGRSQRSTALHEAVTFRAIEAMEVLLEHGADANATDLEGRRPLEFVQRKSSMRRIISLLLSYGAKRW